MDIALYYAPHTCAIAPYITLTEAGADFEVRPLNLRKRLILRPVGRKPFDFDRQRRFAAISERNRHSRGKQLG